LSQGSLPLPCIDQIIDDTAGCARLSFLDAYSGYNQIKLKVEDEESTAFITSLWSFCYQVMPFGLINDVVSTTRDEATLIDDLQETFDNLDRYKLKINPTKCSFGVPAKQLLEYKQTLRKFSK
jgi:hypothetical protein